MQTSPNVQADLAFDLHIALNSVPLEGTYESKIALYAKLLSENHGWTKISSYSSEALLDLLPIGYRCIDSRNAVAIKTDNGWDILTTGNVFSRYQPNSALKLPVYTIPQIDRHQSSNETTGT